VYNTKKKKFNANKLEVRRKKESSITICNWLDFEGKSLRPSLWHTGSKCPLKFLSVYNLENVFTSFPHTLLSLSLSLEELKDLRGDFWLSLYYYYRSDRVYRKQWEIHCWLRIGKKQKYSFVRKKQTSAESRLTFLSMERRSWGQSDGFVEGSKQK